VLEGCDAAILIGDAGMTAECHRPPRSRPRRSLDKPKLTCVYVGRMDWQRSLTEELASYLYAPPAFGEPYLEQSARPSEQWKAYRSPTCSGSPESESGAPRNLRPKWPLNGWSVEMLKHYLYEVMHFDMTDPMLEGYREFQRRLLRNGFSDCHYLPMLVEPALEPSLVGTATEADSRQISAALSAGPAHPASSPRHAARTLRASIAHSAHDSQSAFESARMVR